MLAPPLYAPDRKTVFDLRSERLRMRLEIVELIAGARRTIVESRALLVEADDVLAKEKLLFVKCQTRH
jgi:hypothetical protein